jgi:uncharacterized protein (DUF1697 family)
MTETPIRHAALMRGVNVGRAKRIAMADLRKTVSALGYTDVSTVLNSGNIIFSAPPSETENAARRIEEAVSSRLGVASRVTVLTGRELDEIVAANPLLDIADNPSRLLVAVLSPLADASRLGPLTKRDWSPEVLAAGERAAYLWCPGGVLGGKLASAADKALGEAATTRNWATMMKLRALTSR